MTALKENCMVVSQGRQHLKINKAQVPHPGRPWQMRVIHSLAQFLREASQAGQAVPGTSPSDADEVHLGVGKGKRRREALMGNFKQFCWCPRSAEAYINPYMLCQRWFSGFMKSQCSIAGDRRQKEPH